MDVQSSQGCYWRAAVYNQYTGGGWVASGVKSLPLDSYKEVYPDQSDYRHPVTQTFTIYRPAVSLLFAASQPEWFDVSARLDGWSTGDTALDPALIATGRSFPQGTGYGAVSLVSDADIASLRQAGQDYPAWVRQYFLDLPDTLPERVRDLAREITAAYDNPYDKAAALEQWMRMNITYDDQIGSPPSGRDVVDYLVFESKRGYCDYYASGMAVMARAVGLPARVVAGYARGTFDNNVYMYRVQEKDSHSWVEVYFPKYGWIEFEPTASQPLVARPTPPPAPSPTSEADAADSLSRTRTPRDREFEDPNPIGEGGGGLGGISRPSGILPWLIGSLVVIGLLLLAVAALLMRTGFDSWSLHPAEALLLAVSSRKTGGRADEKISLYSLAPVQRAYARLMRLADWLNVTLSIHHTPHERGELFCTAIPQGRQAISTIVGNYTLEQYGRGGGDGADSRRAWEAVRVPAWQAGVQQRKERVLAFFNDKLRVLRRFSSQFGGGE
jgi:transglutaminase-like putative cysteine protease